MPNPEYVEKKITSHDPGNLGGCKKIFCWMETNKIYLCTGSPKSAERGQTKFLELTNFIGATKSFRCGSSEDFLSTGQKP